MNARSIGPGGGRFGGDDQIRMIGADEGQQARCIIDAPGTADELPLRSPEYAWCERRVRIGCRELQRLEPDRVTRRLGLPGRLAARIRVMQLSQRRQIKADLRSLALLHADRQQIDERMTLVSSG